MFDYTQYNYDELVEEITRILKEQGEWKDSYNSSTGQVLIQLLAAMTDQLHYMLERRTQESFLPTARLRSSVGAISNLLGYRPRRATSARGFVELSLLDDNGLVTTPEGNVIIPKYSTISLEDDRFVNINDININPTDEPPYVFEIKEGTISEMVIDTSDPDTTLSQNGYVLIHDFDYIDNDSFYIRANGIEYFDVRREINGEPALESLAFATGDDPVYDVRITNEGLQILFGDGTNGMQPTGELSIKWIDSKGSRVSVPSTGLEFEFSSSTLQDDETPANLYHYRMINNTPIEYGREPESISDTKRNAPNYIRSGARAVTKSDYVYWTKRSSIGGIIDATAFGEQETGTRVINANNVYITYLTSDGSTLSEENLIQLREYLDVYKGVTTHPVITPAEIIPLQINLRVKRSRYLSASNSEIYDYIRRKMIDKFKLKEGSLGNTVHLSDIYDYVTDLVMVKDGVTFPVVEYVTVGMRGLKKIEVPLVKTEETTVSLVGGHYGDRYVINVNGIRYAVNREQGESLDDVAWRLAKIISLNEGASARSEDNKVIVYLDGSIRRNEILWSNDLTNPYWVKRDSSIVVQGTGPDNNEPGFKLTATDRLNEHYIRADWLPIGLKTFTIRAKADELSEMQLSFNNHSDGRRSIAVFDLEEGVISSGTGFIEYQGEGWYECSIVDSVATGMDTIEIHLMRNGTTNFAGDGTEGLYIGMAQVTKTTVPVNYVGTKDEPVQVGPLIEPYTISLDGSTTPGSTHTDMHMKIPTHIIGINSSDQILPNSVELIKEDGEILVTDDGEGNFGTGTIDYKTGDIFIDVIPDGTYYLRYSQDIDDSFSASDRQVLVYHLPKDGISNPDQELSTIEII